MTRAETDKLFALMAELFAPDKSMDAEKRKAAWYLALKRYPYEQARDAALQVSLEKKFFPELAELARHLPKPEAEAPPHDDGCNAALEAWLSRWWETHLALLREKGLPTALEARDRGMDVRAYWALLEAAGL